MSHTNRTLGRVDAPRCSICRHPDREDFDRALVLKRVTQADVARRVGVDRSTVSRHVKNHVLPNLVQTVILETKEVAIGNIAEAIDRTYGETQEVYERAMAEGDLRLAAQMLDQQRRIYDVIMRYSSKMGHATLQDLVGRNEEAERAYYESVREGLIERLDDLAERHQRGIVRHGPNTPDEEAPGDTEDESPTDGSAIPG